MQRKIEEKGSGFMNKIVEKKQYHENSTEKCIKQLDGSAERLLARTDCQFY